MQRFSALVVGLVLWFVNLTPISAQNLRDEDYLDAIQEGIGHIYRVEHDEAIKHFTELSQRFPDHPGPPLARALTIWLRELFHRQEMDLDNFISPGYFTRPSERPMPEEDLEAFFGGVEESKKLAEGYLERNPEDKDGRYYLGTVEATLGVFAFTVERSYMKALRHGKKSYQYQKAIVDEDPEFYDSYMTVGTYEYILGNLPWYVKWLATIAGYRGSEERGFEYLVLAAEKSVFVNLDARVLLMVLYVREKEYAYGLEVAQQLQRRFPENFLIHLNQAQILERIGEREKAMKAYTDVIELAEQGRKNYQKLPIETFRYTVGRKLVELDYPSEALALFQMATRDPKTPPREKALSHLRAGELLDLMGRREEAIAQYEEVQRLRDIEGSHKAARRFLKKPYRGNEVF
jgi:tetratricopeptide (TPR) repeat protein